jgi:hypothetical protein
MPTNYRSAIQSFKRHAREGAQTIARDVSKQIAESLVLKTPVDTSRAEANWISELNTIPQTFDEAARNPGGVRVNLEAAIATANRLTLGDVFVMANSTPYIIFLEEGSSRQAPAGMRDVTAAMFGRMVERAKSKLT